MKNYCVMAFHSLCLDENGNGAPCCLTQGKSHGISDLFDLEYQPDNWPQSQWNNQLMKNIRKDLIRGETPSLCSSCFDTEKFGGISLRERLNKFYDFLPTPTSPDHNTLPSGERPGRPLILDLQIGNTCNLRCRMCHPTYSHALTTDFSVVNGTNPDWFPQSRFWGNHPEIMSLIERASVDGIHLRIIGGEPMISPQFKDLVKRISRLPKAADSTLTLNTNLTKLDERLFDHFSNFKKTVFIVSLDGTKEVNEFIRYPSSFSSIENNLQILEKYLESGTISSVEFNTTVQIYNILNLPSLIRYLKDSFPKFDWAPALSPLTFPSYFSIQALPPNAKSHVRNLLLDFVLELKGSTNPAATRAEREISGVINFMFAKDSSSDIKQFRRASSTYDVLRKQKTPAMIWRLVEM